MDGHQRDGRPRIVIIGGGFGGAYCAQALERQLGPDEAEVVLLDLNNYFVFYPLLVEAGTGSLEPRHAVVSIRAFLTRTRFIMGEVTALDTRAREVRYHLPGGPDELVLDYDQLVFTPGSVTRMPDVPGLAEHAYQIKSLADAVQLRDRAIQQLELADATPDPAARRARLHFVVVGANFTGVEVAGEYDVFLARAAREYPNLARQDVRVTLVELGQRILPALDADLAEYARQRLERRGVRVELETSVACVKPDRVELTDGRTLAASTVIWCAGIAPHPLVRTAGLPVDERGWIRCRRDLRVEDLDEVWAIGDSAMNPDADGNPYPATAQHAVQQGKALARNLALALRGSEPVPCDISSRGVLAALGCRTAVARVFGAKLSGFPAWFLWRTVYLLKMPGWARRARVALDWTVDLFFRRDVVQLGLSDSRRAQVDAPGRRVHADKLDGAAV